MARNDSFNQPWASVPAQFERPGDGLIARGWAGGASEDPPEAKWENWWHNRVDLALQELQNLGQLIWFADAPYQAGARVSHGGNSYIALSENTDVEPTGALDIGVWRKEGASTYLQTANNLAEIAAAGPEAVAEAQSNLNLAELLGDALQKANNLSEIKDAGPAAVAQTLLNLGLGDAAKKGIATNAEMQVGTADKLVSLIGLMSIFGKRDFTENDYIRIPDVPGGLIIQWCLVTNLLPNVAAVSPWSWTLPIPFPNKILGGTVATAGTATPLSSSANLSGIPRTNGPIPNITGSVQNTRTDQSVSIYCIVIGR
ncbi:hypothetical protein ACHZG4_002147 [Yersinia enterocolitica]|uniref:gp53-like domain-containing protein n=1 Tax=Yersinia enterocolitica TaxID=630 RepID=UPI0027FCC6BE|nr:hypothetical protein [Yersinia enterocolitica]HEF7250321.1 hypothetical protein [Yersinia enterocolitica]HEF7277014.1 hypothetical protein [Yersinia enterocolitica]